MAKNYENTSNADYTATVVFSSRDLSAREKIQIKDTGDATTLDKATENDRTIEITPSVWAEIRIHNEKSKREDKDYSQYVIIDLDGTKYTTGSESFWSSFLGIADELMEAGEDYFTVKVYTKPSKNFEGKRFISCSLI